MVKLIVVVRVPSGSATVPPGVLDGGPQANAAPAKSVRTQGVLGTACLGGTASRVHHHRPPHFGVFASLRGSNKARARTGHDVNDGRGGAGPAAVPAAAATPSRNRRALAGPVPALEREAPHAS